MDHRKLKVGSTVWDIEWEYQLNARADSEGQTHHTEQIICIDKNLPEGRAREVLIHEILHVCADFVGVREQERLSEEEYITRIAPVLTMVLMDNPWILGGPLRRSGLKELLSKSGFNDSND